MSKKPFEDCKTLVALIELTENGFESEKQARSGWLTFMNSMSKIWFPNEHKTFDTEEDVRDWFYNPAYHVRMFRERNDMRNRFLMGNGMALGFALYFPKMRIAKFFVLSYIACPEFYSIFNK